MSLSSQRIYLSKLMRDHGLCGEHLETIVQAVIISLLGYALSAWGALVLSQLNNVEELLVMLSLNIQCFID